jgi:putative membrane protein
VQWWCSASSLPWTWHPIAYPGVWLLDALIAYVFWRLSRTPGTSTRARVAGWCGVALIAVALDWPVGPLAAGYLASVHAVQFLLVAIIAPPLLLLGLRHGIAAHWPRTPRTELRLRRVLNPLLAAVGFNLVVITTHMPRVNDTLMPLQAGAFAVDAAWLLAGLWFWWPITVRVPYRPLFAVPLQMLYLFLGTMAHSGIAIVMLVRDHPLYAVYELAPRITSLSAMDDLQWAGGIMEIGGGIVIFGVLTVMFFRWTGTGAESVQRG